MVMKKFSSFLKSLGTTALHFLVIAIIFWLISLIGPLWLKVPCYLFFGAFALIDIVGLFFEERPKARFICSKVMMGVSIIFGAGFLVWLLTFVLRFLNFFFLLFGSNFRIGWILNDPWNIIFSFPGLLTGIILFFFGFIMNADDHDEKVYREKLLQKQMAASKNQEATAT